MVSRSILEQLGDYDIWGDYQPNTASSATTSANQATADNVKTCWLNQFSALKIYGPDAERFLQGQLTCNLNDVNKGGSHYGACCSAKGRVVANFHMSFDGEVYWLVLPSKSAEILDKHLQKYKVFFKATIENCRQSHLVMGQWQTIPETQIKQGHCFIISDHRQIVIIPAEESQTDALDDNAITLVPTLEWQLDNIKEGIYFVDNDQHEQWIPQHINWHRLEGISFNKGCYTGQEIIARLQYLGKAKKALYHYSATSLEAAPIANNGQIFDKEGKNQGEILLQRNGEILAVLNGENPDSCLYLTDSQEFPLTLQNLPYTDKKDA
tara:strand:+ start:6929 stop:7900 length:972 start_codon:yes stop_codon:yes gene_type:complete